MSTKRVVIWLAFILVLLVLLLGGLWFGLLRPAAGKASDPSYALISSPLNDAILFAGDPVYVQTSAVLTHRDFGGVKLYVDGKEFVLDQASQAYAPKNQVICNSDDPRFCGPADLSLLWIAAKAGTHSLSVCLMGDQKAAAPWNICTEEVSVVVTDLSLLPPNAGTYLPQAGDSIASVADKFGLPAVLVAAANPDVDPAKALTKDVPLNIPSDPSLVPPSAVTGSINSPWTVATVKISTDQPIEKGYCYYSFGANYWTRVPAGPQTFSYPLNGQLDLTAEFRSLTIPSAGGSLALECWGWSGATLVQLGSGKTTFVPSSSPIIQLKGDHFDLEASLETIPGNFVTMKNLQIIPPPQGVTGTNNVDVCIKHGPPADFFLQPLFCKAAVENGDTILVWDWFTPTAPPTDPTDSWLLPIDGYHVYIVWPGLKPKLIMTIPNAKQKTLDISPIVKSMKFFGSPTFFVRAYVGPFESADSNHYVLASVAPGLATVTLYPSVNHYGGPKKVKTSGLFCSAGTMAISGSPDIGGGAAVGYDHYWPEDSCLTYIEEYSRAYFTFDLSSVKGPVSSAYLTYRQGYSSAAWTSCARDLGVITTDPSYDLYELLSSTGFTSAVFKVDVTSAVRDWMSGTPNNGFVFVGADESLPGTCGGLFEPGCIGGGTESCWTAYDGHQLIVTYFIK